MDVIGLIGPSDSERKQVAQYLESEYGYRIMELAEGPRRAAAVVNERNGDPYYTASHVDAIREAVHLIDQDVWVGYLARRHMRDHPGEPVVIPDLRYVEEGSWVRAVGGMVVAVVAAENVYGSDRWYGHVDLTLDSREPLPEQVDLLMAAKRPEKADVS